MPDDNIYEFVIFMMGAGGCPEAPVAEGDPSGPPRGEPPGLVPRGAGAKGSFLHQIESHKKRCFHVCLRKECLCPSDPKLDRQQIIKLLKV